MRFLKFKVAFPVLAMLAVMFISGEFTVFTAAFAAAAIHETGHIVAANLLGVRLSGLSLDLLGARLDTDSRLLSYRNEILLCAAGPAVNFISIAFSLPLSSLNGAPGKFFSVFTAAALGLGLLNLLPVSSFDGGRIINCILSLIFDSEKAYRITRYLSFICIFTLWSISVYLIMRTSGSLSVFVFSVSLFARLFVL